MSPSTISPGEESFIQIFVAGISFGEPVTITFAGPAGQFVREVSAYGNGYIVSYVPDEVMGTAGDYSATVRVQRGELLQNLGTGFFSVEIPVVEHPPLLLSHPDVVFIEAVSLQGAQVDLPITSNDGTPVTCNPASGSMFPFGPTTVKCSATNQFETVRAEFTVMIGDTTPPEIFVPNPITTDNPVVSFVVTATDNLDPEPDVFCSPASGSTFTNAVTKVNCRAIDHHLNYAFGSFTVTITGGKPVLNLPEEEIVAQATASAGVAVEYVVTASEDGVVTCTPPSGFVFPLGTTTVNCSATNAQGTSTGSFLITVVDFVDPFVSVPPDIIAVATSPSGAVVNFVATAHDAVSGELPVTCNPPSGTTFPLGVTPVECYAIDQRGNAGFGFFKVTVIDNPPPVITVPNDITREATGPDGRSVSFAVTATNDGVVSCSPASGSVFPLGTTTVNCTATNAGGSDSDSFKITIVDTTPPDLVVPADITTEATSFAGAVVTYVATATDLVDGTVAVNCVPASGSTFVLGTTLVQCTATDARGNSSNDSFNVNVVDTTPPEILSVKPSISALWPPNHRMEPVEVFVIATDIADPSPVATIISVSSNQPVNGTGDGDSAPDWVITGPLTVELRSERAGIQDRIYTITVEVTDASGNSSTATTTVRVTQSRRR